MSVDDPPAGYRRWRQASNVHDVTRTRVLGRDEPGPDRESGDPAPVAEEALVHSDDAYESLFGSRPGRVRRLPGLEHLGARFVPGRAGLRGLGAGQVGALDPDGGDRHD